MYPEIFTIRINYKNILKSTSIEFASYALWLFVLFKHMYIQSAPVIIRILFIAYPVIYFFRNFLIRICYQITVNTVEQKFVYRRFLRKTEIFFKKDIINFTREYAMISHVKEEYLIIQTATSKISLRCTDSHKNYSPFSNKITYSNLQVLTDYLNS